MQITCKNCRALCCKLEVMLIDDSDDQVPEAFFEKEKDGPTVMKKGGHGWCLALDSVTYLCTIYERRPFLCREYQVGDYDCLNERKAAFGQELP